MADHQAKAISVRQPWAWAIIHAGKDIENRSLSAIKSMGGDRLLGAVVYIHAAKAMKIEDFKRAADFLARHRIKCPERADLLRGGAIGTVRIVDSVDNTRSFWFDEDYFGLVLEDAKRCAFIPAKGQLNLFTLERA